MKYDYWIFVSIVAPYEADAQLAFLNQQKIADIIITEDSDLILFGCDKVIVKWFFYPCLIDWSKIY